MSLPVLIRCIARTQHDVAANVSACSKTVPYDASETPGGEGWIANQDLEQLCQFRPTSMSTHAKWVEVRTFHWTPPSYPPVPKTSRRMLRQNAIHAWQTMLKTGWGGVVRL